MAAGEPKLEEGEGKSPLVGCNLASCYGDVMMTCSHGNKHDPCAANWLCYRVRPLNADAEALDVRVAAKPSSRVFCTTAPSLSLDFDPPLSSTSSSSPQQAGGMPRTCLPIGPIPDQENP